MEEKKNPRKWTKLDAYTMRSPPYQVCKKMLDGCTLYQLWQDEVSQPIAHLNSFDEIKEFVEERERK